MLRKQRKLQPWRRFGYVILIIIKSGELLLWFSPRIINGLRSYIKHSKGCFIRYPNTLKLVKKNSAAPRFLNHFSVFGYRMKHSSSCLIYYVRRKEKTTFENKILPTVKFSLHIPVSLPSLKNCMGSCGKDYWHRAFLYVRFVNVPT